jgi:hypothetical protein
MVQGQSFFKLVSVLIGFHQHSDFLTYKKHISIVRIVFLI